MYLKQEDLWGMKYIHITEGDFSLWNTTTHLYKQTCYIKGIDTSRPIRSQNSTGQCEEAKSRGDAG